MTVENESINHGWKPEYGADVADPGHGDSAWRKRVAVLVAIALAAIGLTLLERSPASAASAPHVVHAAHRGHTTVDPQVANLNTVGSQLQGAASLLKQSTPGLDATTAASTIEVADGATQAAVLSQRLAAMTKAPAAATAAGAHVTAAQLQAALATTQAKAAVANRLPITLPIKFCNFVIKIGPIVINIPRFHIHIVIGPFFIRFRAPCFLSGIIPTHIP
ncbi:MAG: hypothetical protein M3256_04050 [Actinomycetota bacterium]|nr:hypothetical protein [Actinomycetota bacterium]